MANFDMYTPEGNALVERIAVAARKMRTELDATMTEVAGFVENNLMRLSYSYPEAVDTIVRQNVADFVNQK